MTKAGGLAFLSNGELTIRNSLFVNMVWASGDGGLISNSGKTSITLANNTFLNDQENAMDGASISLDFAADRVVVNLVNNLISNPSDND